MPKTAYCLCFKKSVYIVVLFCLPALLSFCLYSNRQLCSIDSNLRTCRFTCFVVFYILQNELHIKAVLLYQYQLKMSQSIQKH